MLNPQFVVICYSRPRTAKAGLSQVLLRWHKTLLTPGMLVAAVTAIAGGDGLKEWEERDLSNKQTVCLSSGPGGTCLFSPVATPPSAGSLLPDTPLSLTSCLRAVPRPRPV